MANKPFQQIKLDLPANFDLLQLYQFDRQAYPFLLESVAQGELGQFDILFAFPQKELSCASMDDAEAFVDTFHQDFDQQRLDSTVESHLPFHGGWFAYFSYDYAQIVEPSLNLPKSELPLAKMIRVPAAIVYSHQEACFYWVCEQDFVYLYEQLKADLVKINAKNSQFIQTNNPFMQSEENPQKYLQGVKDIKEYILDGDIFQVNLSREWQVNWPEASISALYDSLRKSNPAPFAACVDFGDWQILSSSPERLVKFQAPWVETRPIAGTRKRSEDTAKDLALIDELISHPKERAEHIMLIDLERNDLGRICIPGSVEVNELMVVESYEHVHHIVSNVRGKLQQNLSPLEVVHAVFPGGTITGCPKVRCMEIIAELEQMPRKAYTGSLGYINRDGSLDLNILIRTILKQGDQISFRAGAGIVADSIPEYELEESHHKAKGMIRAIEAVQ